MARVVVVGSLNVDHTVRVERLPAPGETVSATDYTFGLGGKGFNQAVTAARMGADVVMVGCVGADTDGDLLFQALHEERIDASYVRRSELPTGRAHLVVDANGQNSIVVVAGANAAASFPSAAIEDADVLLAQLECPLETVAVALAAARAANVITILNPAPARPLTDALLRQVDYLVPNARESEGLGAVEYHGTAIVTSGRDGARLLVPGQGERRVPAFSVPVVDTTGAGDAFCGCFAAALAENRSLSDALRRASAAGACAVTRAGAFSSLPTRDEVEQLLSQAQGASESQS